MCVTGTEKSLLIRAALRLLAQMIGDAVGKRHGLEGLPNVLPYRNPCDLQNHIEGKEGDIRRTTGPDKPWPIWKLQK